jgi:hypothetical protein
MTAVLKLVSNFKESAKESLVLSQFFHETPLILWGFWNNQNQKFFDSEFFSKNQSWWSFDSEIFKELELMVL